MRRLFSMVLVAGATAAQISAQLRITGLDGLASKAKESVDLTLDSSTLKLASGFLSDNSKDKDTAKAKELLDGLKGIIVKSFEFEKDGQYRMEDLDPIRAQLRAPGWNKILNVQSKEEISEIYMRTEQGKAVGFAIIAAEPKELTVISIEGAIALSDLSKLGALGVPSIRVPEQSKDQKRKGK